MQAGGGMNVPDKYRGDKPRGMSGVGKGGG